MTCGVCTFDLVDGLCPNAGHPSHALGPTWIDATWADVRVGMVVRRDIGGTAEVMSMSQIPTAGRSASLDLRRFELMFVDDETLKPTGRWDTTETVASNFVRVLV